jgi:hypothetical protein
MPYSTIVYLCRTLPASKESRKACPESVEGMALLLEEGIFELLITDVTHGYTQGKHKAVIPACI